MSGEKLPLALDEILALLEDPNIPIPTIDELENQGAIRVCHEPEFSEGVLHQFAEKYHITPEDMKEIRFAVKMVLLGNGDVEVKEIAEGGSPCLVKSTTSNS